MSCQYRPGPGPGQVMLMPADPRDWLPPGHLAWKVLELAAEMDLSRFGASYRADRQGGRPCDPEMMATLLLYCYCRGRRSCREIEAATWDDVGARVICGGLHPDHSTIAEFMRRHLDAIRGLLPESVKACAREGLVSLDLVAGDGTKLKANASMAANMTAAQLAAQIAGLEAVIDAEFRTWTQDMLGDGHGGNGDDGGNGDGGANGKGKGKEQPKRPRLVLERRKAALAELADRAEASAARDHEPGGTIAVLADRVRKKEAAVAKWEKAASDRIGDRARKTAAGQRVGGTRPVTSIDQDREVKRARKALAATRAAYDDALRAAAEPAPGPGDKVNATDPSSRVMPLKKGGYDQPHNVQALATARTQVILAIMRHPSSADTRALPPLMDKAREILDAAGITGHIREALFDAGYASDANFTLDTPARLYIAVTREARQTGRSDQGRDPATMPPSWQDMAARLGTEEGRELYKQRGATIEPVFAQLTNRLGRTLNHRGDTADAELALWAASHNILKAISARVRRPAPAPAPATQALAA